MAAILFGPQCVNNASFRYHEKVLFALPVCLWNCFHDMLLLHKRACRKVSNISRTLVGNNIVDHSDIVGASPVGAAPTTSSFSTWHLASMDWVKTTARRDEKQLFFGIGCVPYIRDLTVVMLCQINWAHKPLTSKQVYFFQSIYLINN